MEIYIVWMQSTYYNSMIIWDVYATAELAKEARTYLTEINTDVYKVFSIESRFVKEEL